MYNIKAIVLLAALASACPASNPSTVQPYGQCLFLPLPCNKSTLMLILVPLRRRRKLQRRHNLYFRLDLRLFQPVVLTVPPRILVRARAAALVCSGSSTPG